MRRILVPTDGSPEGERGIPIAAEIARAQKAEMVIVSVIDEPPIVAPGYGSMSAEVYEQTLRENQEAAAAHLAEVEAQLVATGVRARTAVHRGPSAAALLDAEVAEEPDLVVMATHGRTGLARFALGSVADRMVREGTVPVLLVRRSTPVRSGLKSALVMLDGSGLAEKVLPVVEQLAGKPLQEVTLYRVVADPDDRGAAMHYLEGIARRLKQTGIRVKTFVDMGDPRYTVRRAADHADLVILCTHGRTGVDRLRHGSVAEAVIREIDKPTQLVRDGAIGSQMANKFHAA